MGKLESQSFPFVPVLCPSVYTCIISMSYTHLKIIMMKYVSITLQAYQHISPILLSNISCLFLNNNRMGELH